MKLSVFFSICAVVWPQICGANPAPLPPGACSDPACLNAVLKNPVRLQVASAFCSTYILSTATATVTAVDTVTAPGPLSTTTTLTTTTTTAVVTNQAPDVITLTTTTTTATVVAAPPVKRDPGPFPACIQPAQYSSACTCVLGSAPVTTVTATVPETTTTTQPGTTFTDTSVVISQIDTTTVNPPTATVVSVITAVSTTTTCGPSAPTQVVQNPDFATGITPWVLSEAGNSVVLRLNFCGLNQAPASCNALSSPCHCVFANADSPGGTAFVRQTLSNVCAGQPYALEAYVGRSDNIISGSKMVTTTTIKLDGVTVFGPTFVCELGQSCPLPGGSGPYTKIGPITVTPGRIDPVLSFEFATDIPAGVGIFSIDVFLDYVTLTKI